MILNGLKVIKKTAKISKAYSNYPNQELTVPSQLFIYIYM